MKEITDLLEIRHNDAMNVVSKMLENQDFGTATRIDIEYKMHRGGKGSIKTYQLSTVQALVVIAKLSTKSHMSIASKLYTDITTFKSVLTALNNFEIPDDLPDMYVYVIEEVDTGNIKLGISKHPERRLKQLQTGNSSELRLLGVKKAHNRYKDEKALHETNSDKHIIGEWFSNDVVFN